uniref:Uncharacterized protein n=1 Tax=Anguilla anguilla TaxID=7936 RepID=A0A0E9R9S9_ANGAN
MKMMVSRISVVSCASGLKDCYSGREGTTSQPMHSASIEKAEGSVCFPGTMSTHKGY